MGFQATVAIGRSIYTLCFTVAKHATQHVPVTGGTVGTDAGQFGQTDDSGGLVAGPLFGTLEQDVFDGIAGQRRQIGWVGACAVTDNGATFALAGLWIAF